MVANRDPGAGVRKSGRPDTGLTDYRTPDYRTSDLPEITNHSFTP